VRWTRELLRRDHDDSQATGGENGRAGGAGDGVGATEERRTAGRATAVSGADTRPCCLKVAVHDHTGACEGGAVRRSACGADLRGTLPSAPRLRRRRSSGWVRWTRELLRRNHEGSQARGAFASANPGGACRPRPGRSLCGAGGRVAVLPHYENVRARRPIASAGRGGGRHPYRGQSLRESRGGSPSPRSSRGWWSSPHVLGRS
jgi:hypothetical protein